MSTVTTTRPINVAQFAFEFGQPITASQSGSQTTIDCEVPTVTQAQLQAAVDAHVAVEEAANAATLRARAANALAANKTYLARATPTAAQNTAQIRVLTQECDALIRLVLNKLDATD